MLFIFYIFYFYRPNRLTHDCWSCELNWVPNQNKHQVLACGTLSDSPCHSFAVLENAKIVLKKARISLSIAFPLDDKPLLKLWINKCTEVRVILT